MTLAYEIEQELPVSAPRTINLVMENEVGAKPPIDEVLAYAGKQADKYLRKHASHLPDEQKDEIRQETLLRVALAYGELDPSRGWKAFVQTHARGSVLDYLRAGSGFKETGWAKSDPDADDDAVSPEDMNSSEGVDFDGEAISSPVAAFDPSPCGSAPTRAQKFSQRLNRRASVVSAEDDQALDVEEIAGLHGIHSEAEESSFVNPKWDLIARMAAVDPEIHLIAKILRGFTQTELAKGFEVTREMLSQRIRIFFNKLDDPQFYHSPWVRQTIFAFGLEEFYHVPQKERGDRGLGWENSPVDLDSAKSLELMTLFHQAEFNF